MPFNEIFYHIIWKIASDSRKMNPITRSVIKEFITKSGKEIGYIPLSVAVLEDHIHILVETPPDTTPGKLVITLKNRILDYLAEKMAMSSTPVWDENYGIVSVSRSHTELVAKYIDEQEQRHKIGKINRTLERTE